MRLFCLGFCLLAVLALFWRGYPSTIQAQIPQISVGMAVTGFVVDENSAQDWQFEAQESQTLSIIVNRISGDLDPNIQLLDDVGEVLAENDDRIAGLVLDAGIQEYDFEAGATYTLRIGSFDGTGDYQLWLVPAYERVWEAEDFENNASRWAGAYAYQQAGRLVLDTQGQIGRSIYVSPRGQIPVSDFYLQAEFEWIKRDPAGELGLVVRSTTDSSTQPSGYYFMISADGTWTVRLQRDGAATELSAQTGVAILNEERLALGVRAEGATLTFYANGENLGSIEDGSFTAGNWGVTMRSVSVPASAAIDHVLLTVPATSDAPDYPSTLQNWRAARPDDIAAELVSEGVVAESGRRVLTILSTSYQIGAQMSRVYLQTETEVVYSTLVVSVDVVFTSGDNLGCGLALRHVNDANQVMAYADLDGGAALLALFDGVLRGNTYDLLPILDNPLPESAVRLLAIAQGEWVALYANGRLLATQFVPPGAGGVGVALFNYSTSAANCTYNNFWLWTS